MAEYGEHDFVLDGEDNIDAQFAAVTRRMAVHAATLVPEDATEE